MDLPHTWPTSPLKRDNLRPEEIKEFLERHGAKYVSSVTAKTSYVVTGDAPGANKIQKASALGIPVVAERDFYSKFNL